MRHYKGTSGYERDIFTKKYKDGAKHRCICQGIDELARGKRLYRRKERAELKRLLVAEVMEWEAA